MQSSSSSCTMSSSQGLLQIWVVGNPTSGGKRGAAVLDRMETLFSQTFGRYAVHTTSSSSFLHTFSPHSLMHASPPQGTGSKVTQQPSSAAPHSTPATARWNAAAVALSAHPTGCSSSSVDSTPGGVALHMIIIRTDESGHAKAVSHALSRVIQRSRLENDRRDVQTHRLSAAPSDPAATRVAKKSGEMRMSLPLPRPLPTTTDSDSSSTVTEPLTHHVVIVVGGDGTLSEVTNGLCEGTLSGFEQLMPSGGHRAETAANALHSHVEREAAVLSCLLPALVYVPGGTGSDFGKLRLCCRTPEEALRLVRDGLIPQLFPLANHVDSISSSNNISSSDSSGVQHRKKGWRYRFSRASPASPSLPPPPASAVCVAHAVDIGRIEFLRTGTRHFFINECSVGMSCDVIQRAERYKRNRWISRLGGRVLFAMASFFSLLHMTPKPLYICKLPSRVPLFTNSATWMDRSEKSGGISEIGTRHPQWNQKSDDDNDNDNDCTVSMGYCDPERESNSAKSYPETDTASRSKGLHSLLSAAPFSCLGDQLDRLSAQLWRCVPVRSTTSSSGHQPHEPLHTTPSCCTSTPGTAGPCTGGATTYITQGHTLLSPPHAHMIQCTRQTPSCHDLLLLDITPEELQTHHMHQEQQQSSAAAGVACSKTTGKELIDNDVVAGTPVDPHDSQVRSGNFSSDSASLSIAPSATTKTHHSVDDYMQPCSSRNDSLSLLTWVEMPSSMLAFANGRWYGGGMLVAPHANPKDGLISCTNWVATLLPFVLGAPSLYTGRHVGWKSTSAFDGHRFLISNVPSLLSAEATKTSLLMEADGEVLEAAPAIVELCGKITFLVPSTAVLRIGSPAPGTTRERFPASQ